MMVEGADIVLGVAWGASGRLLDRGEAAICRGLQRSCTVMGVVFHVCLKSKNGNGGNDGRRIAARVHTRVR